MNTFSTSPSMALSMARYTTTEPAQQVQARAALKAIRAQQRQARATRHLFNALVRRFTVPAPAGTPARVR
jgi:hypothetical protein